MGKAYDAFFQGVDPGAPRNRSDVRLLVLYAICRANRPISFDTVLNALNGGRMVNYFEAAAAVENLFQQGQLSKTEEDGIEKYIATETGRTIVDELEQNLPKTIRQKALRQVQYYAKLEKHLSENEVEIRELEEGYEVSMQVGKGENRILQLTLYAANRELANAIRKGFLESPENVCQSVLDALFHEKKSEDSYV